VFHFRNRLACSSCLTATLATISAGLTTVAEARDPWKNLRNDGDSAKKPEAARISRPAKASSLKTAGASYGVSQQDMNHNLGVLLDQSYGAATAGDRKFVPGIDGLAGGKKWRPHVEFTAAPGSRSMGQVNLFAPLVQNSDSMLFADLRASAWTDDVQEGNFGIGYRQIVPGGFFGTDAIFGVYGFVDARHSAYDNMFYQGTFGAELITEHLEFRANAYLPSSTQYVVGTTGGSIALDGFNIVNTGTNLVERALPGFDVEAGVKIDFSEAAIRLNAGYFRFERGSTLVEGPRFRAEVEIDDPFGLDGAKLSFGGEIRTDKVRGTEASGIVRLRMPIGGVSDSVQAERQLSGLDRLMTRRVYRDDDIVTPVVQAGSTQTLAPVTDVASGESLQAFFVANTAQGAADCSSVANACEFVTAQGLAGAGDTFVPVDATGPIGSVFALNNDRQRVIGAGDSGSATLVLPDSASSVLIITSLGGRPIVTGINIGHFADTRLAGLTTNSATGVTGSGFSGSVTVNDVRTLDGGLNFANSAAAISVTDSILSTGANPGLVLSNLTGNASFNNVDVTSDGGTSLSIDGGSLNATFDSNSSMAQSGAGATVEVLNGHSGTLTSDAAISAGSGAGLQFNNADGAYNFNGPSNLNGGDAGIDILGGSAGTFAFGADTAIVSPTGMAFTVTGSAATVNYNGTITQNNAATAVSLSNNTGGSVTFGGQVTANTSTSAAVDLAGNTGATVSFTGGLDIATTAGTGFSATGGGTISVAATAGDESITSTAGQALNLNGVILGAGGVSFDSISSTGSAGSGIDINGVSGGGFSVSGATTVSGSAGNAIQLIGNSAAVNFNGATTLTMTNAAAGVDFAGATSGAVSFANLDIALQSANATGIDLSGAVINADVTATDFDLTSTSATGTTGVNLSGTTGTGTIRLGDSDAGGQSATIAGVGIGVQFSAASNATFIFGDGEGATDRLSSISATTAISGGSTVTLGSYDFDDVNFTGTLDFTASAGDDLVFVAATATGDFSGSDVDNRASVATADAIVATGTTFILINDGAAIDDIDGFTLADGQTMASFGNGRTFTDGGLVIPAIFSGVPSGGVTITDPTSNGAAILTRTGGAGETLAASGTVNLQDFILENAAAGAGLTATGAATIMSTGLTVQNVAGQGIDLNSLTGAASTFDNTVVATTTGNAIDIVNSNINFTGGLDIDTTTGTGFSATGGGTISVAASAGDESITSTAGRALNLDGVNVDVSFDQLNTSNSDMTSVLLRNLDGSVTVNGGTLATLASSASFNSFDVIQNDGGATRSLSLIVDNLTITHDASGTTIGPTEHGIVVTTSGDDSAVVSISNSTFQTEDSGVRLIANNGLATVTNFANNTLLGDATSFDPALFGNGVMFQGVTFDADISTAGIQAVDGGTFTAGTPGQSVAHGIFFDSTAGANSGRIDFANYTANAVNFGLSLGSGSPGLTVGIADGDITAGSVRLGTGGGTVNGDITLSSLTLSTGLSANQFAGSFAVTGATTITAPETFTDVGGGFYLRTTRTGISVLNSAGSFGFGDVTIASAPAANTTTGGSTVGINLNGNSGTFTVSGTTTISDTVEDSIRIASTSGAISFGETVINTPHATPVVSGTFIPAISGNTGIDISGTIDGAISFADLAVALGSDNTTAFDLSGATLNAAVTAEDFDVTSTSATGTIAIDLRGTTGGQVVRLGDAAVGGESSSIAGVHTGVFLNAATHADFTFGDGESGTDTGSTIDATVAIDAAAAPVAGTYDFQDVAFTGSPGNGFGTGAIYFVDSDGATGGGDGSGSDSGNPMTLAAAEAAIAAGDIIIMIDNGAAITAAGSNANDTLNLLDNVQLLGFGDGAGGSQAATVNFTAPSTILLSASSVIINDPTGNGAATLTTGAGENVVTLGASGNRIAGLILEGGGTAARGIKDNGAGATNTTIANATIRNFATVGIEITPSTGTTISGVTFSGNSSDVLVNAAGTTIQNVTSANATGTAFQIVNATGTTTLTNIAITGAAAGFAFTDAQGTVTATNVDIAGGGALSISGGDAAFSFDAASSIANTAGTAVSITGRIGGTFSHFGTIASQSAGAGGIVVSGATGAETIAFAGTVDLGTVTALGAGAGVSIDNNGQASAVTFADLDIATAGQTALSAANGGSLTVTAGSVAATTGQAVALDGLAIGGGGVNLSSVSSTGSAGAGVALVDITGGAFTVTGTTTVSGAAGNGIQLAGNTSAIQFGVTNVTMGAGAASAGIDFAGIGAGAISFGATTITNVGAAASQKGIDFNGATLGGTVSFESVAISGPNTSTDSIGVDLTGVLGNQFVNLGSQVNPAGGPSSSITDLHRGVVIDSTAAVQFAFGDGEDGDTGSSINVNGQAGAFTVDAGGGTLGASSFDFNDVAFGAGDSANLPAVSNAAVFVSETGGIINAGTHGLSASLTTITVDAAEALADGDQTFVFVAHSGFGTIDLAAGGVDGFTLKAGQSLNGFDDGTSIAFGMVKPVNIEANFGVIGGTVTQDSVIASNTFAGATSVVATAAGGGGSTIQNTVFDATGLGAGDAVIRVDGTGAASPVTINNVEISNVGAGAAAVMLNNNSSTVALTDVDLFGTNAGTALSIDSGAASTAAVTVDAASDIDGTTGTVVAIGGGARDVTISTAITTANNTANVIDIDGQTGGTIGFAAVSSQGATGDSVIEVTGQTGGALSFGAVDIGSTTAFNNAAGTAVNLAGTGGSVSFAGLSINATAGAGLVADGPTLGVAGSTNSLVTSGATALGLSNLSVGAGGITFATITAASGGANAGIDIDTVTTSGGNGIAIGSADLDGHTGFAIDLNAVTGAGSFTLTSADIDLGTGGTGLNISGANTGATIAIGNGTSNSLSGLSIDGGANGILLSHTAGTVNIASAASADSVVNIGATTAPTTAIAASGVGGSAQIGNATTQSQLSASGTAVSFGATAATGVVSLTNAAVTSSGGTGVTISSSVAAATTNLSGVAISAFTTGLLVQNNDNAVSLTNIDINQAVFGVFGSDDNATGSLTITGLTVDNTTDDAVQLQNIIASLTNVTVGADVAVTGDAIQYNHTTNAAHTLSIAGLTIGSDGDTNDVGGRGIFINQSAGSGTVTVSLSGANEIHTTGRAIETVTAATANILRLGVSGTTTAESGSAGATVAVNGDSISATQNSTVVTGFSGVTVIGNGTGGGVLFDNVTFDADTTVIGTTAASSDQVAFGALQIGQSTSARVLGNGLTFNNAIGDVDISTLNIFNTGGTGLSVDTKGAGTDFQLTGGGSGTIDTTTGAALFLDPLATDLTFGTVSSTGSGTTGVTFDVVTGVGAGSNAVTIATLNISGATDAGVLVSNSSGSFSLGTATITGGSSTGINIAGGSAAVSFGAGSSLSQTANAAAVSVSGGHTGSLAYSGAINATNGTGLQFDNADGSSYSFNGTVTLNGGDAGVDIVNGSSAGFTFTNTNITSPTGAAFNIDSSNITALTFGGSITQNNAAAAFASNGGTGGIHAISAAISASTSTANAITIASTGTYNFSGDLGLATTSGAGFLASGGGTMSITGTNTSINTTSGQILGWNGVIVGAGGVAFDTLAASGTVVADAISLINVDGATFNGGAVTVNSTSGGTSDGIEISGGSSATFNFAGATINNTGGDGIRLDGANGVVTIATVNIDNAAGDGIDIAGNTNAININGGTIDTSTGAAVRINAGSGNVTTVASITNATGALIDIAGRTGGTVTFSNTVAGTGGTGISITGNTGGAIQFNGATTLNTGANDAITLNGNNGASITFANVNIDTTTGNGIDATGINTDINVSGTVDVATAGSRAFEFTATSGDYDYSGVTSTQSGISAQAFGATHGGTYRLGSHTVTSPGVNALTMASTTLDLTYASFTVAGTNPTGAAILIDDTSGSLTINGGTIRSDDRGIDLQNDGGVLNAFVLTTANVQFDVGNDAVFAETTTAGSTLNVNVSGVTVASNIGAQFVEIEWDDGSGMAVIANNTVDSGDSTFGLIEIDQGGTGTTSVTLDNNIIASNPTGEGIDIRTFDGAQMRVLISNNTVTSSATEAIRLEAEGTSNLQATVTNNIVGAVTTGSGIYLQVSTATATACLNATGNSDGVGGPPAFGLGGDSFNLDNTAGGLLLISQADVAALGAANNTAGVASTGTITGNVVCTLP